MDQDSPVLFSRRGALAIATLNLPKALNALNLSMIDLLSAQLDSWAEDDEVAAIWIDGSDDKALCAGGDVVALYRESAAYGETPDYRYPTDFFSHEYRLDYKIHTCAKPIVVWGGGIVMGGGIGIMAGASHRIVTETTRMAMPEITIGLFPDVGGSWFLNRMPGRLGLFLGLTGAPFNGADALFAGMADRIIAQKQRKPVLSALQALDYSGDIVANHRKVNDCLKAFELPPLQRPESALREHYDQIQLFTDFSTLPEVCAAISAYQGVDKWLQRAASTLAGGSPLTPWVVWEQLRRSRHLCLADIYRMELVLAVNLCGSGHFKEGVRALLVDKDREPKWQPASLKEISPGQVEQYFEEPWGGEHPLADL
ncbi:enoyl-CoA hydratase/isomerase family protein [Microbulbifer sp. OS29]|uniref:3-hydroxyisobutyryl-CoA hydrolase n=1 Tax=Microbulbifer okhotskensis TaxID=2926617 RepID=A0A9X2EQA1_9GAMM|nr:enoyl-CoA hydratase/isomerase family protein [Microbulbifer okhotskensis]MCO1335800.1 enoyl-CoA hydratase/isomerase family protein [Microbulbifer okhotskensis]